MRYRSMQNRDPREWAEIGRLCRPSAEWQFDDTWALVATYFVAFEFNCWYPRGALSLDKTVRQ